MVSRWPWTVWMNLSIHCASNSCMMRALTEMFAIVGWPRGLALDVTFMGNGRFFIPTSSRYLFSCVMIYLSLSVKLWAASAMIFHLSYVRQRIGTFDRSWTMFQTPPCFSGAGLRSAPRNSSE